MHNTTRCGEIDAKFPGLLRAILAAHAAQYAQSRTGKRKKRTK
jgi:hypothetical protein